MLPWVLCWLLPLVAAQSSSITRVITNSNLASDFSINTDGSSSQSETRTSTIPTTTSMLQSAQTENSEDRNMLKFIFTERSNYFDAPVTVASQSLNLRLDLLQNNLWVLNGNDIQNCSHVFSWLDSVESQFPSSSDSDELPASVTTASEYTALYCVDAGAFTTDSEYMDNIPEATADGMANFEPLRIPYINSINASGEVLTGNVTLVSGDRHKVQLPDFLFVNVNSSNVYVGGFGLSHNGLTGGVMDLLVSQDLIAANGYSLFFGKFSDSGKGFAQVLPGVVNQKYYVGDMMAFDVLARLGARFERGTGLDYENELVDLMIIPSAELDDLVIENPNTGNTLSLKPNEDKLAIVFDTRTIFNMVPLDVIVSLAIQTNAYFNEEVNRWIVECDTIRQTGARINFKIHGLDVRVPIEDLLINATSFGEETQLTFSGGAPACYLTFLPTVNNYATLGLSFLKSVYLAVDNEGGKIGMATSNRQLDIKEDDYLPMTRNLEGDEEEQRNYSSVSSIDTISSGGIPFATTLNETSGLTLEFVPYRTDADTLTIPARFSGIMIASGEVFVTQTFSLASNLLPFATAASEGDDDEDHENGGMINGIGWMWIVGLLGMI